MPHELPFRFFDCDNHYYEATDAFTRHIEPEFRKRAMQWAEVDGKLRLLVGGKVNKFELDLHRPPADQHARQVQLTGLPR